MFWTIGGVGRRSLKGGLYFADKFHLALDQKCLLAEAGPGAETNSPSSPLQAAGLPAPGRAALGPAQQP